MNCIIIDDDSIQISIFQSYIDEIEGVNCIATFKNPIEFLKMKNKFQIDFIILDMEMPKMNGVDLLESLTEPVSVLVISSKPKYAIDVINHNVIGYLLKPLKFVDFMKTIEKVKLSIEKPKFNSKENNQLFIKSNGMLHNINYNEILYITAAVDYIEIQTKNKKFLVHTSMNKTKEKLPTNNFYRIHRSTIINVNHIKRIDRDFVEINEETLKIAPGKKEDFLNFIHSL